MELIDVDKLGFFHLCPDIKRKLDEDDIEQLEYWLKSQKLFLKILEDHDIPRQQMVAVQNTIGVYMFQIPGQKENARIYFEHLLDETDYKHNNTIANMLHILSELSNDEEDNKEQYESLISSLQKKLQECNRDELDEARSLCEKAYFLGHQFEGYRKDLALAQTARHMFELGIEKGGEVGMSQNELYVWNYYLVYTVCDIFHCICIDSEVSEENIMTSFKNVVDTIEDFSALSREEGVFYHSRVIVNTILVLTTHDVIMKLPNFESARENSILGELWEDRVTSMEVALEMSAFDYHIPATIARVYIMLGKCDEAITDDEAIKDDRAKNYDKAIKYADIALSIERSMCVSAYTTKLMVYANMAKDYEKKTNQPALARDILLKAYQEGKKIEKVCMTLSAATVMARVCFHLAVDKSNSSWWNVPKERTGYINEAIAFNHKAIALAPEKQHSSAERQLSDCLWALFKLEESFFPLRKALQICDNTFVTHNFKSLSFRYCKLLQAREATTDTKMRAVEHVVEDFINVWEKNSDSRTILEKLGKELINFTGRMIYQEQYLKAILDEFSKIKSVTSIQMFDVYCQLIKESERLPHWLKEYTINLS